MTFSPSTELSDNAPESEGERMWPLDLALAALGGLVMYVAATHLSFDDVRWQYNAWTYVAAIPIGVLVIALVLHLISGRLLQRSVQFGFMISVFVHLLLLMVAVNLVVFGPQIKETFAEFHPKPSPIRKTVSEVLFRKQGESTSQADWSQPVQANLSSRIVESEAPQKRMREKPVSELAMPDKTPKKPSDIKRFLPQRSLSETPLPSPVGSPQKLARLETHSLPQVRLDVVAPDVNPVANPSIQVPHRVDLNASRNGSPSPSLRQISPASSKPQPPFSQTVRRVQRRQLPQMPRFGAAAASKRPARRLPNRTSVVPVGPVPAAPSFSLARIDDSSGRLLRSSSSDLRSQRIHDIPLIDAGFAGTVSSPQNTASASASAPVGRPQPLAGVPHVSSGREMRASGRAKLDRSNAFPFRSGPLHAQVTRADLDAGQGKGAGSKPRLMAGTGPQGGAVAVAKPASSGLPNGTAPPLAPRDLVAEESPFVPQPKAVSSVESSVVSIFESGRASLKRRSVGGPMVPAGREVRPVDSFKRRVTRTGGGAPTAPPGAVGPDVEKAIERGLQFLAKQQAKDGSWSLQGNPQESVALRSDTAATGLCLLSFQGAGYTHRQHQHAHVLLRGLDFLLKNQQPDGDLFRPEDTGSNKNVWMYSHAIAALALCEAYGMTQDPKLEKPAQKAIDFIVASQHPIRGGWRYRPRNSSDTSVSGWMMMALKSGQLSGLRVPQAAYQGIDKWLAASQQSPSRRDRYRYNPYAPNSDAQRHGRDASRTMTAVGMLMRMYSGWRRDNPRMQSGADYLLQAPPTLGTSLYPTRDTYYWYYATQVMFHMGGQRWKKWNSALTPLLVDSQLVEGSEVGSWDPRFPVPDRWGRFGGRLYVTTMNLLSLEVYYRHLPIYEETAR